MGTYKNQNGFSPIEAILLLVIVGIIGFVGWYVHNTINNTDKDLSPSNNTAVAPKKKASTAPKTTAATNYFTIKEWGVRAPAVSTTTLTYSVDPNNANNVLLNSQQLADADPSCAIAAGSGNAGYIGRYLPTDDIPTVGTPSETAQAFVSQDFKASNSTPPAYSKVGNYYYIYWTGQSSCTSKPAADSVLNQTTKDINTVVDSLSAVPN